MAPAVFLRHVNLAMLAQITGLGKSCTTAGKVALERLFLGVFCAIVHCLGLC
jgi:hypothetical protein